MNKLKLLSKTLSLCGLGAESALIKKIARQYMNAVLNTGLSSELYENILSLERDISSWDKSTRDYLMEHISRDNPNVTYGDIDSAIRSCFYDWKQAYAINNDLKDSNIPPWFFDFFEP